MALFWGRGRQKWRRPPVRSLPSFMFPSFLAILFVWTSLNRDLDLLKRQDRWEWMEKPCDGIPWCPYPMIVTQHSRKLVAATTSRTNQSRPRTLGTGKPMHGDKHKTRARRINFPSSVIQGHYPRIRTVRREMIVNLPNTCLLPTHFWRHSNIVERIFWWNYFDCRCCFEESKMVHFLPG